MRMKAVIFDMDGVIFDSERAVFNGWKELEEKYGFANLEIPYFRCIGTNFGTTTGIFKEFYGEDFPFEKLAAEQSENYHKKYDGGRLPLKKGIRELLTYLKENGYYTAVASSTRSSLVRQQIIDAGFELMFDRIIGGDMVTRSKPEPDIFLMAAEGCGADIGDIFVIEDSFNGIRAASRAGMRPIMVPDLVEPDDEIKGLAETVLPDLLAVKEYISASEHRQ